MTVAEIERLQQELAVEREITANLSWAIEQLHREPPPALAAAAPELLWFAQQIFNGIDTKMLTLDTPADEILAVVLQRGRAALALASGVSS